jgi:choline dehydrogenase-like flavoprotein
MTWDPSVYDNGPVHVTIPDFQYPDVAYFRDAWKTEIGIDLQTDISAGSGPGIYWSPSTIDRRDETRVTARKEYYDPVYSRRPNLHLQTGQTVIEILFQNLTASGIRMISRAKNCTSEIYAKKEVILAAGAVKTPQLLQLSGIGPMDVLNSAGIEVKKDVPAVGANFQDNPIVSMLFNITAPSFPNPNTISANETYNATVWNEYSVNRTGPIAAGRNSFGAFLSLSQLSTSSASIVSRLSAQNASQFLPSVYNFGPLLRGFEAQRIILAKKFTSDSDATSFSSFRGIGLSPSVLLKPLSRGTITLNLTDPWGEPVVQYNTLMNPIDTEVILAIVKRQRAFWKNSRLAPLGIVEIAPGIQYQTDDEMLSAITKDGVLGPTFAHPSGTCAMMPEELGGCVSPSLQVYGVQNLSIVDASMLPLITGAGLQATMYAVAEKAADLIKARAQ